MIELKPKLHSQSNCPYCNGSLAAKEILWQGLQFFVETQCQTCKAEIIEALQVGFLRARLHQLDLKQGKVFGSENRINFLPTLQNLQQKQISIKKEVFNACDKIIILNCIDPVYGHALLKLLNAQRHLEDQPDYGLIVIIQPSLRWLVPATVAEVWVVDLPFKDALLFYPCLNQFIHKELSRFREVQLSETCVHPGRFDISFFTRVPKHDFQQSTIQLNFIWREDRLWLRGEYAGLMKRLKQTGLLKLALQMQNWRIRQLFQKIKTRIPTAQFVVTGLGTQTRFPDWIKDARVNQFDQKTERTACQIYADSRLVIGVHGSNMLLPSGHAGMSIDIMPDYKLGQLCADILYQEQDPRLAAWRYRSISIHTPLHTLATLAVDMILVKDQFYLDMTADQRL